jgi:hypothetical protein
MCALFGFSWEAWFLAPGSWPAVDGRPRRQPRQRGLRTRVSRPSRRDEQQAPTPTPGRQSVGGRPAVPNPSVAPRGSARPFSRIDTRRASCGPADAAAKQGPSPRGSVARRWERVLTPHLRNLTVAAKAFDSRRVVKPSRCVVRFSGVRYRTRYREAPLATLYCAMVAIRNRSVVMACSTELKTKYWTPAALVSFR